MTNTTKTTTNATATAEFFAEAAAEAAAERREALAIVEIVALGSEHTDYEWAKEVLRAVL